MGDANCPLSQMPIPHFLQKFPRPLKELQGAFSPWEHKAGPASFEGDVGVEMLCLDFRNSQPFKDAEVFFPESGVELDFVAGVAGNGLCGATSTAKVTAVKMVKSKIPEAFSEGLDLGAACVCEFAVTVALVALCNVPAGFAVSDEPDFGVRHSGFQEELFKSIQFRTLTGRGQGGDGKILLF